MLDCKHRQFAGVYVHASGFEFTHVLEHLTLWPFFLCKCSHDLKLCGKEVLIQSNISQICEIAVLIFFTLLFILSFFSFFFFFLEQRVEVSYPWVS